jgi:hypothetical protein
MAAGVGPCDSPGYSWRRDNVLGAPGGWPAQDEGPVACQSDASWDRDAQCITGGQAPRGRRREVAIGDSSVEARRSSPPLPARTSQLATRTAHLAAQSTTGDESSQQCAGVHSPGGGGGGEREPQCSCGPMAAISTRETLAGLAWHASASGKHVRVCFLLFSGCRTSSFLPSTFKFHHLRFADSRPFLSRSRPY